MIWGLIQIHLFHFCKINTHLAMYLIIAKWKTHLQYYIHVHQLIILGFLKAKDKKW